ncbi:retrotransposon hot spot (RHS) protein [Trypanosoma rangeli]|uniref:Retrotransposon hot spot (RHS) protein n=1 Tax=Trypanosoma rangeli TaxID=5698 RepID=A0A422MSV8_TRYRA|nr:retrotransposon hot spot (RHS) protein [Trypanosoma rangeli]RNE96267.1 retrotransposon hot spot (RHS) protein [Trypanosoma rangeli]|eukprot:RNE96267.1 retrotransposon hot spot (RHS) protein [Trypanosoma rangeli]
MPGRLEGVRHGNEESPASDVQRGGGWARVRLEAAAVAQGDTADAAPLPGSQLRAALAAAKVSVLSSTLEKLEGHYEDVCHARWGHVMEVSDGRGGMRMEVREGRPPQPWEYKVEGATVLMDDGAAQFRPPRLSLVVLTSEKWPYALRRACGFDCYVYSEVERVWQIVEGDLAGLFGTHGGANSASVRRVLIGTPGIGKSAAACSYLLYQLLHYDAEQLHAVAYFIGERAFLFDKTTKTVFSLSTIRLRRWRVYLEVSMQMRGYIICDVMGRRKVLPTKMPPTGWGMLAVSSPNETRYRDWEEDMGARRIIMNGPDERDVMAMCAWRMRGEPAEEQAEYRNTVQKRMARLGPVQRYAFTRCGNGFSASFHGNMEQITTWAVNLYVGLDKMDLWSCSVPTEDYSKMVRVVTGRGTECFQNAPGSASLSADVLVCVAKVMRTHPGIMTVLMPHSALLPSAVEGYAIGVFMYGDFVRRIRDKLSELRPLTPAGGCGPRPCLLQMNPPLCPTDAVALPPKVLYPGKIDVRRRVLYVPGVEDFPLLDAFFFVESPRRTMVGLQTAPAKARQITTNTVKQLNDHMAEFFNGWDKFARSLSWEIVYVQRGGKETIQAWQGCGASGSRGQCGG